MTEFNTEPVTRNTVAKKIRQGVEEQGWMIVGTTGSWLAIAELVCQHLERKGVEVKR